MSSSQRLLSDNTQHSQDTDIHVHPGGIRNRNPSKQAAADLHFRPRGQRNRRQRFRFFLKEPTICCLPEPIEYISRFHNLFFEESFYYYLLIYIYISQVSRNKHVYVGDYTHILLSLCCLQSMLHIVSM